MFVTCCSMPARTVGSWHTRVARVLTPERAYYFAQIYPIALGIVAMPFLFRILGANGYAVVAFSNVLFGWASLMDIGFSAALSRWLMLQSDRSDPRPTAVQAAVAATFAMSALIGVLVFGGLAACSGWLVSSWLKVSTDDLQDIRLALATLMLVLLARWIGTVPRAVLYGQRRLVFLTWQTILFSSLRQIACLPLLYWWQGGLIHFFLIQLVISLAETLLLYWPNRAILVPGRGISLQDHVNALRPLRGMAFALAGTSLLWLLMSQTDRLVLSSMLSLHDYGVYSVAMTVAGAIPALIVPMTTALLPRLVAEIQSARSERATVLAYRRVVSRLLPLGMVLGVGIAALAEPLIHVWTGNAELAAAAAPILAAYALGNGIQVVSGLPYFLQYARGDLRLHLIGNMGFVVLFLVGMVFAVPAYGAIGAGLCWMVLHAVYSIGWVSFVHRRLIPSYWLAFLWADVLPSLALSGAAVLVVLYMQTLLAGWPYLIVSFIVMACVPMVCLIRALMVKA